MKKMKYWKLVLGVLGLGSVWPTQASERKDTLFVNAHQVVMLVFPEPIRQAVVGDPHFVFTYNKESGQYMGLLQGTEGVNSNLFVITVSGQIYNYVLAYKEHVERTYYKIVNLGSVGKEQPGSLGIQTFKAAKVSQTPTKLYEEVCSALVQFGHGRVATKRKQKLRWRLEQWRYIGDAMYLVVSLKNKSEMAYVIDTVRVFVSRGRKGKKSSYQQLELPIENVYQQPQKIEAGGKHRWVLVLPKKVMETEDHMELQIDELHGDRSLRIVE